MIVYEKDAQLFLCARLGEYYCKGSKCMAWTWKDKSPWQTRRVPEKKKWQQSVKEPPRPANLPDDWTWEPGHPDGLTGYWIEPKEQALVRATGYCGLLPSVQK